MCTPTRRTSEYYIQLFSQLLQSTSNINAPQHCHPRPHPLCGDPRGPGVIIIEMCFCAYCSGIQWTSREPLDQIKTQDTEEPLDDSTHHCVNSGPWLVYLYPQTQWWYIIIMIMCVILKVLECNKLLWATSGFQTCNNWIWYSWHPEIWLYMVRIQMDNGMDYNIWNTISSIWVVTPPVVGFYSLLPTFMGDMCFSQAAG